MELILTNPILLKKSLDIISELVLEGTFVFKPDYMELIALNPNNVVMVIFRLLNTNFIEYNITEEKQISISLEHFNSILKSCDEKSNLILDLSNNNKLKIVSDPLALQAKEFAVKEQEETLESFGAGLLI